MSYYPVAGCLNVIDYFPGFAVVKLMNGQPQARHRVVNPPFYTFPYKRQVLTKNEILRGEEHSKHLIKIKVTSS